MEIFDTPDIWTGGKRGSFVSTAGFEVAGVVFYVHASEFFWGCSLGCYGGGYGDARLERYRAFMLVPGQLQKIKRADFWGAIIALQSKKPCHSGIDKRNVSMSIGKVLFRGCLVKHLPLVKNGDVISSLQ